MIDFIRAEATLEDKTIPCQFGQTEPFKWLGIEFAPRYNNDAKQLVTQYTGLYMGLHISLLPDRKPFYNEMLFSHKSLSFKTIRIGNSLHKFHKGNNYSNFGRSEITKAISNLCDKFDIEAKDWEIKKLEFGFNISVPEPAKNYIPLFLLCKKNEFQSIMTKNNCFEKKCFFSQYAIKAYDKNELLKLEKERIALSTNILRIEMCYNQKEKLPKRVITLADLQSESGIRALHEDFNKTMNQIVFAEEYNFDNLKKATSEERNLFWASFQSDYLKVEEKVNNKELKATKAKIKQLRERLFKKDFKSFLLKALKTKWIELFCS